jgi:hypothetical protein
MTADQNPLSPEPGPDAGIDDIQADIEHTRKELGETIGALSAKADVTGQVQHKSPAPRTASPKRRPRQKVSSSRRRMPRSPRRAMPSPMTLDR